MSEEVVDEKIRSLRERGYAVFERAYDDAEVPRLTKTLARLHALAGSPECYFARAEAPRSGDRTLHDRSRILHVHQALPRARRSGGAV